MLMEVEPAETGLSYIYNKGLEILQPHQIMPQVYEEEIFRHRQSWREGGIDIYVENCYLFIEFGIYFVNN